MGSRLSPRVFLFLAVALLLVPGLLCAAEEDFLVKQITVTGNQAVKTEDLARIVQAYEGKRLTLTDLQKVAGLITEEYQKRGYVIAKAYVPEQEITDGIVRIGVLEGTIGEVRVEGSHKYYSTQFIKKHFDPIMKEKALNQSTLERALLVLNEYPRLNVQATLQAGKDPGTTDIVVKAENTIPIHLTVDYNNFGSKYTSRDRFGAQVDIGNVIKEGAVLSARGITGDTPSDMLLWRASYSIPLNTLGTRLAAYYAKGDYDVGEDLALLGMKGKSESFGISLSHPFIKKRLMSLTAEAGFDWKDTKQYLLHETTSHDKIRSLRGGATFEQTGVDGRTYASAFFTAGLGHTLGGMENNDPYASRQGADNNFARFNFDVIRLQKFTPSLFLIVKGSAQLSLNKLVSSEQFYIGGADSVRGYGPGEFYGDDGYTATAELRVAPLANKEKFQLAFFVDNGFVSLQSPPAGVRKTQSLTGGGGGIRLVLPYEINIRADLGIPLDPNKSADGKTSMVYLQALKRF